MSGFGPEQVDLGLGEEVDFALKRVQVRALAVLLQRPPHVGHCKELLLPHLVEGFGFRDWFELRN